MSSARVFFLGGWLAYRGLFRFLQPSVFIPMMIVVPIAQMLFFLQLGRYVATRPPDFYVVGNALCASTVAGLFALSTVMGGERQNGTLLIVLASPVNRVLLFAGRAVPAVCCGLCTSSVVLAAGLAVTGDSVPWRRIPLLMVTVLCAALSSSALGLALGSLGLRMRDINFAGNVALSLMMLLCGANLPLTALPAPLRALSDLLPLTRSVEAARRVIDGRAGVGGLLGQELLAAAAFFTIAVVSVLWFERAARSAGTLEIA